jgi:hypothetical protein
MKYADIDPIIDEWAKEHSLVISKSYKEYEVRSVDVVDKKGGRYQIWIDLPESKDEIKVSAWDFREKKIQYDTDIKMLFDTLEKTFSCVQRWKEENEE